MTVTTRILATIGATALVASGATFLVMTSTVSASGQTTYRLRPGDYVAIEAPHWTCSLTNRSGVSFTCSTDDKPISNVNITPGEIVVAARTAIVSKSPSQDIGRSSTPMQKARGAYSFAVSQR